MHIINKASGSAIATAVGAVGAIGIDNLQPFTISHLFHVNRMEYYPVRFSTILVTIPAENDSKMHENCRCSLLTI